MSKVDPEPQQTVVVVDAGAMDPEFKWSTLVTSVVSVFCCTCCGIPAMVLSLLAYSDHKTGDLPKRSHRLKQALALAITAIVLGCIGYLIAIVVPVVTTVIAVNAATDAARQIAASG